MKIEGFLAARRELGEGGFYLWGALVRVDGIVTWSAADCIGGGASHSVAESQYIAAIAVLKKLGELRKAHPKASITLYADADLIIELESKSGHPAATLDECIDLIHRKVFPLTLRYCSRSGLRAAHSLIDELCKRNGVNPERIS
jgi:hypothetical protein